MRGCFHTAICRDGASVVYSKPDEHLTLARVATSRLDTFRALHEHDHQLADYCTCSTWARDWPK
jgi:hypothetical protein